MDDYNVEVPTEYVLRSSICISKDRRICFTIEHDCLGKNRRFFAQNTRPNLGRV